MAATIISHRDTDDPAVQQPCSQFLCLQYMETQYATIYLAGGCFWCVEAVLQRLHGVIDLESGYMNGQIDHPTYKQICTGLTGHAEAVKVTYDPTIISYTELLTVFFTTHDPTTLNQQGNDRGTQYRSAIFYLDDEQRQVAEQVIAEIAQPLYADKIVTEVTAADTFYKAENYHQDYYNRHSYAPYCRFVINPKVNKLRSSFQHLLKEEYA